MCGLVVTESRKLASIVGIAVAITLLVTVFTPIVPTLVTSEYYTTNHCLVIDPPPDWCFKILEECEVIGCVHPGCEDQCPYLKVDFRSLIDVWSVDQALEIERSIELHIDNMPGSIIGDDISG